MVVLRRGFPRVRILWDVAEGGILVGVPCVGAEPLPVVPNLLKALRSIGLVVSVARVRQMAALADPQRLLMQG